MKYLLIITLIALLLTKPTYCFVHLPREDKIRGCKMPLVIALWMRLVHPDDILLVRYKTFKKFWEQVEKS